jgi:aerobic-type carbon monoxide dehydrogenase small subunit (CoxS/CutS family)
VTRVELTVNAEHHSADVEPRLLLSDFLRHELGLTGTHVGCEHGVCGACTVLVDGAPARACLMLAVQAHGCAVRTIEGLARDDEALSAVQQALADHHGLQCGFCTPGVVMSMTAGLEDPDVDDGAMLDLLGGHICRCTGYQGMRDAAEALVRRRGGERA